jgi:prepilin peptidase CpaA
MTSVILLSGLCVGLMTAAITDIRDGRIPNWLTFSLCGFGLVGNSWLHGWEGFFWSVQGLGLGIVCLVFFYIKGGMGAGDVKLLGAIGAVIGPVHLFPAFLTVLILGGVYSVAMMISLGGWRYGWERLLAFLTTLKLTRTLPATGSSSEPKLRYALVIGLGTIMAEILAWYEMW